MVEEGHAGEWREGKALIEKFSLGTIRGYLSTDIRFPPFNNATPKLYLG